MYTYVKNQEKHHKKRAFREEYIGLLEKFGIEYDEKYLFRFFSRKGEDAIRSKCFISVLLIKSIACFLPFSVNLKYTNSHLCNNRHKFKG